jgi:hypothetical protein
MRFTNHRSVLWCIGNNHTSFCRHIFGVSLVRSLGTMGIAAIMVIQLAGCVQVTNVHVSVQRNQPSERAYPSRDQPRYTPSRERFQQLPASYVAARPNMALAQTIPPQQQHAVQVAPQQQAPMTNNSKSLDIPAPPPEIAPTTKTPDKSVQPNNSPPSINTNVLYDAYDRLSNLEKVIGWILFVLGIIIRLMSHHSLKS